MIDPNAPASAVLAYSFEDRDGDNRHVYESNGLTIRAELASRAMQGFLSSNEWADEIETAIKSVKYADALIAELNKGE